MNYSNLTCGSRVGGSAVILLLYLLLTPLPAQAYLDPTTGSMVISAVVGLFASLVLAVRTYWYKLKGLFRRNPVPVENDDENG